MSAQGCIAGEDALHPVDHLPGWVPVGARMYLSHIASGRSLRALARDHGCHASTVMRQVRHFENRRDDPLVDDALRRLDQVIRATPKEMSGREPLPMMTQSCKLPDANADQEFKQEAMRYLRLLTKSDALLIVAPDMQKAIVTQADSDGVPQRVAVLGRHLAEAMALKDWITCRTQGRVSSYVINAAGRHALHSFSQPQGAAFEPMGENDDIPPRRIRYTGTENPVTVLARRRDKSGLPFLESGMVQVAARLREDFVMAQLDAMELSAAKDLVEALETRAVPGPNVAPPGTRAARKRVLDVFHDLGPGLGDMALRCCCRLEGVESAENALGWSARSGKIVLRIALQRLSRHYQRLGDDQMMIG